MTKPFLVLQLRPEDVASDDELASFLKFGGLSINEIRRVRMEQDGIPELDLDDFSGVIMGGGPFNVSDKTKPAEQQRFESQLQPLLNQIVTNDIPFLGACYGIGALTAFLDGAVSKERYSEPVGAMSVNLTRAGQDDPLIEGVAPSFRAFGGHKEACQVTPDRATLLAGSEDCPVQMIRVGSNVYATQFHPELDADGLATRINIYKHAGYFDPEDAEKLIAASLTESVTEPMKILKRFVERYRR